MPDLHDDGPPLARERRPGLLPAGPLRAALPLLVALAITWHALLPWHAAALLVASSLLTALPGVLAVRRLYGAEGGATWITACCFGPAWGYALTSLVLLGAWWVGLRHPAWLLAAPGVAGLLAWVGVTPFRGLLQVPSLTRRDAVALGLLLLLVPAIVGRPFARVDAPTPEGRAWRAYFTADVVWAMAVVAEVEKGDLPPRNPYRLGDSLHYYWLAHLTPAMQHRLLGPQVRIHQVLLADAVLSGVAFLAFLYLLARHVVGSGMAAACGAAFVVLCHSFEGAEQLITLWSWGAPLGLVQYMNIDAVTRWVYKGMPVDGLQRLLLYQPQHQLGYMLGLSGVLVLVQARDRLRPRVVALVSLLLAASLLLSTFSALMLTTVACGWLAVDVVRRRALVTGMIGALVGAVPLSAAVLLANGLEYVEHGGALVSLRANPLAFVRWHWILFLSFGGIAIAGGIGVWLLVRARELKRIGLPLAIIGVSLGFYFFVDVRDHQNVYVGWRAGHLILIAAIPLAAAAVERARLCPPATRWMLTLVLAGVALAAVPTVLIDLFNTQDITNFAEAPGFRWTLLLSNDELGALEWLRTATPPDAVVQVEPFVRDAATWAWVPAFAERRMSAGLPISMIPLDKYRRASGRVRTLYQQTSGRQAYLIARSLGIDYLVVGPPERRGYPQIEGVLEASPGHWRVAFANATFRIFARVQ